MAFRTIILSLALVATVGVGSAKSAPADSTEFYAAVKHLEQVIIAPCCWHQPVGSHTSPIALQIRQEIRTSLKAGKTPDQIKAEYVRKYGERILAVPPASTFNHFVWIIPIVASIGAFGVAGHLLRSWHKGRTGAAGPKPGTSAATPSAFDKVDEQLKAWEE